MTEYQNMLARLSTIFAQQKALVTRLSRPLPMTPDDINVVGAVGGGGAQGSDGAYDGADELWSLLHIQGTVNVRVHNPGT